MISTKRIKKRLIELTNELKLDADMFTWAFCSVFTRSFSAQIDLDNIPEWIAQMKGEDGNPKDTMEEDQSDRVRWIDTSTMLADPLTKLMKADRLEQALSTGIIDLEPTAESQMKRFMKQQQRSKKNVPTENAEIDDAAES